MDATSPTKQIGPLTEPHPSPTMPHQGPSLNMGSYPRVLRTELINLATAPGCNAMRCNQLIRTRDIRSPEPKCPPSAGACGRLHYLVQYCPTPLRARGIHGCWSFWETLPRVACTCHNIISRSCHPFFFFCCFCLLRAASLRTKALSIDFCVQRQFVRDNQPTRTSAHRQLVDPLFFRWIPTSSSHPVDFYPLTWPGSCSDVICKEGAIKLLLAATSV